jgi:hypothetical protein
MVMIMEYSKDYFHHIKFTLQNLLNLIIILEVNIKQNNTFINLKFFNSSIGFKI